MTYYIWPIFWMGIIFIFSTDLGSAGNTSHYINAVIRFFDPQVPVHRLLLIQQVVRKLAHLSEYAILSHLWFTALTQGRRCWSPSYSVLALLISVVYAGLDEYHQSFVPSRTASVLDVGIDATGALLAQAYLFFSLRRTEVLSPPRSIAGDP